MSASTTITKPKTAKIKHKPARVIVKGIDHGLSGYTNYGCRCDICTDANSEHAREYRRRRFAGNPLCIVPGCQENQSQSYGNNLCWRHARRLQELRRTKPVKARRIERRLGIIPHEEEAA